jgi:hypothetical protein
MPIGLNTLDEVWSAPKTGGGQLGVCALIV